MKKHLTIVLTALLLVGGLQMLAPTSAPADQFDQYYKPDPQYYRQESQVNLMMTKLGRGFMNVFTGWLEVPKQIGQAAEETDPVTGATLGFFRGVAWTFGRTATGMFEILTFPFPIPEDYKPMIRPAYIINDMWGAPIPVITEGDSNAYDSESSGSYY